MKKKDKAIWIYGGEVKERGFIDWLKAHTSFMRPIHRYEGEIELEEDYISLEGEDTKNDEKFSLKISRKDLKNVNHGFDEVFKRSEDRSLGSTLKPLMVEFRENGKERKIYLFVGFKRFPRTSKNGDWSDYLRDLIDKE